MEKTNMGKGIKKLVQLSEDDEKVIKFLSKYKIMLVDDTKFIYRSEWYHRTRIKRLIDEGYLKKYKFYYIELDRKGRMHAGLTGKDYIKNKANDVYMDRLKQISKIGTMTIDSNVKFKPSWEMKEKEGYTDTARKYLGELGLGVYRYLVYSIPKKKDIRYIHQLIFDINKVFEYDRIFIFVDSLEKIEEDYQHWNFRKEHTYIIVNSRENRELLKQFDFIDYYELVKQQHGEERQVLFSDWDLADYYLGDNTYFLNMLFLDIERLNQLKWFYQENTETNKKIEILTLKENEEIIKRLAPVNSTIIGIDRNYFLKGAEIEEMGTT